MMSDHKSAKMPGKRETKVDLCQTIHLIPIARLFTLSRLFKWMGTDPWEWRGRLDRLCGLCRIVVAPPLPDRAGRVVGPNRSLQHRFDLSQSLLKLLDHLFECLDAVGQMGICGR